MAIFDPKTKAIAGYQRQIDEKKRSISKFYDEIGRLYYGQYKDMSVDVTKEINARCESVSNLEKEIKELEEKILFEKGLKLCPNCGNENQLAYAFCFGCGAKFITEEPEIKKPESASDILASEEKEDFASLELSTGFEVNIENETEVIQTEEK